MKDNQKEGMAIYPKENPLTYLKGCALPLSARGSVFGTKVGIEYRKTNHLTKSMLYTVSLNS